ncbi:LOW QUALITY PROTEIN: hepatitis A virus cellular receptor 1 homolog [Lates calcarifer]|uniref:LOW QUALITY PROTEIN: hepatitis A virus cellular receptor 1 homolog n=1 Tax=Lates calcarifer TaxID=8187 RepID=A0AAJ8B862_LATCA|nr:LOW QUALITY PROTEIN: hepatitis A virus cellular receptor 1 homolog [Lates calcarifer]
MRGLFFFSLSILTQVSSENRDVIGLIGHNITLPCGYDTQSNGVQSFCWGQGQLPVSKCSNTILSSYGTAAVDFRQSSRYQLLGRVTDGDISLTILNAQQSDAGVYGCRVEIPGWFNDLKDNIRLVMEEAPVEQPVTQDWTLTTETSVLEIEEDDDPTPTVTGNEEKFKELLEVENIARIGAIFFCSIIIILVLYFPERV